MSFLFELVSGAFYHRTAHRHVRWQVFILILLKHARRGSRGISSRDHSSCGMVSLMLRFSLGLQCGVLQKGHFKILRVGNARVVPLVLQASKNYGNFYQIGRMLVCSRSNTYKKNFFVYLSSNIF